jgi:hypothetical protein
MKDVHGEVTNLRQVGDDHANAYETREERGRSVMMLWNY